MSAQEERFTAIETELGTIARESLTKLDIHTRDIRDVKSRLATIDVRLGTIDNRLNSMDEQLTTLREDAHQTHLKLDAMDKRLIHVESLLTEILTRLPQKQP